MTQIPHQRKMAGGAEVQDNRLASYRVVEVQRGRQARYGNGDRLPHTAWSSSGKSGRCHNQVDNQKFWHAEEKAARNHEVRHEAHKPAWKEIVHAMWDRPVHEYGGNAEHNRDGQDFRVVFICEWIKTRLERRVFHGFWQTIARFAWKARHILSRKKCAIAGCDKRGAYRFCIHEMHLANVIPCKKIDFLTS